MEKRLFAEKRKKIYRMVHVYEGNLSSTIYKYLMIFVIMVSLIPLTLKETNHVFFMIDCFCMSVYLIDYLLRWMTADYKFNCFHWSSFVRYPFRIISIIDILSIFALLSSTVGLPDTFRIAQVFTVFRVIRIFRYSKSIRTILFILEKSKKSLLAVGSLAIGYVLMSAIIVFRIEPESFVTFFDAVYWAVVSLTTVGYGDIYPVTVLGRTVAMISSFFGIAIVALPAGIVTAEYINVVKKGDCDD